MVWVGLEKEFVDEGESGRWSGERRRLCAKKWFFRQGSERVFERVLREMEYNERIRSRPLNCSHILPLFPIQHRA